MNSFYWCLCLFMLWLSFITAESSWRLFLNVFRRSSVQVTGGVPEESCSEHGYKPHILSRDPLVIYIESFLSSFEIQRLTSLHDLKFDESEVVLSDRTTEVDLKQRSSRTAYLTADNPIARCVRERAQAFQGFGTLTGDMEAVQIVKYEQNGHFNLHYDCGEDYPRETSFFVYVYSNGTGGGTNFPRLHRPEEQKWCDYIDCSNSTGDGVTFKPISGNAIFWEGLLKSGEPHPMTLHAGMPVFDGIKLGMNIWTWRKI